MEEVEKPKRISDEIGAGLAELPVFQLNNLIDELGRSSDEDVMDDELQTVAQTTLQAAIGDGLPAAPDGPGSRAANDLMQCARAHGLNAICEAMLFCRLTDELPKLFNEQGVTLLAPTDEAFAHINAEARGNPRLVRQLLLAHICLGTSSLAELESKHCAVALAGQTHAVYNEEPHKFLGTGRLGRCDLRFEGGVIHEVHSVLVVLQLARDSHSEQVWKKTLQPAPMLSVTGGANSGAEYEVHGCLLHAATGQLVPEALRGHIRNVGVLGDEQKLTFSEITVMTKPPSLARRRGIQPDGTNRYRLLFSLWNTSTLSYVSWQHMATPLVVRNSFHMLPLEEKNYRRQQQYARAKGGRSANNSVDGGELGAEGLSLPSLPELQNSIDSAIDDQPWLPLSAAPDILPGLGLAARDRQPSYGSIDSSNPGDSLHRLADMPGLQPEAQLAQLQQLAESVAAPPAAQRAFADHDSIAPELGSSVGDLGSQPSRPTSPPKLHDHERVLSPPMLPPLAPADFSAPGDWSMPPAIPKLESANNFSFGALSNDSSRTVPPAPEGRAFDGMVTADGGLPGGVHPTKPPMVVGNVHDISTREGPPSGGTTVWLSGVDLPSDAVVRFGGVAAPHVAVVSSTLLKCSTPPAPLMGTHARQEVGVQIVSGASGAGVACGFTFAYVQPPALSGDEADIEILSRIAFSIERAQGAAATAAANSASNGAAPFQMVDDHGYSLSEYGSLLRRMVTANRPGAMPLTSASELQMQHQELATMVTRERLSLQIARRPAPETLLQRNILQGPEAEQLHAELAKEKRASLSKQLLNRPLPEQLQDRNILRSPENDTHQQQLAAKRKRLSDFLIERPTIDQLQGLIEESPHAFSSLDEALDEAVGGRMSDASL